MNLFLLLTAIVPRGGSLSSLLLRVFLAIGVFSLEMQLVTLTGIGSLRSLVWLNAVLALVAVGRALFVRPASDRAETRRVQRAGSALRMPWVAVAILATAVVVLNAVRPVTAVDPYHLHRVEQIQRYGSLAYDPAAPDVKTNILAGTYELVLADLAVVPRVGAWLVRFHGVFGLLVYLIAIGAVVETLGIRTRLGIAALLVVPLVFQQFVLIKNDLFGALPALAALVWLVARADVAPAGEIAAAAWLAGFAVGVKLSSFPVAIVLFGGVAVIRRGDWRALAMVVAGGLAGALAAGLFFTAVENLRVYGALIQPYVPLGNRHSNPIDAAGDLGRFAISLVDLGLVSRSLWPGRGGWGGTFGATLIWAIGVLIVRRSRPEARRALWVTAICFVLFALVYPDADLAQRLVLAPGLLLIAVAAACVEDDHATSRFLRRALMVSVAISAAQIARSAFIYLPIYLP